MRSFRFLLTPWIPKNGPLVITYLLVLFLLAPISSFPYTVLPHTVMQNGSIAESGTHAELMKKKGMYFAMDESQAHSYDAATDIME